MNNPRGMGIIPTTISNKNRPDRSPNMRMTINDSINIIKTRVKTNEIQEIRIIQTTTALMVAIALQIAQVIWDNQKLRGMGATMSRIRVAGTTICGSIGRPVNLHTPFLFSPSLVLNQMENLPAKGIIFSCTVQAWFRCHYFC